MKLNDWESMIRKQAGAFDTEDLPEGHEARFAARLDAMLTASENRREERRRSGFLPPFGRKSLRVFLPAAGLAAALALVLVLVRPARGRQNWFAFVGNDPVKIYKAYNRKVGKLYERLFTEAPDAGWEATAESIAEETVPLIDQLPPEMSPGERAAVLKSYYGDLLSGLSSLRK